MFFNGQAGLKGGAFLNTARRGILTLMRRGWQVAGESLRKNARLDNGGVTMIKSGNDRLP